MTRCRHGLDAQAGRGDFETIKSQAPTTPAGEWRARTQSDVPAAVPQHPSGPWRRYIIPWSFTSRGLVPGTPGAYRRFERHLSKILLVVNTSAFLLFARAALIFEPLLAVKN